jgi:hypothetical protein
MWCLHGNLLALLIMANEKDGVGTGNATSHALR